MKPDGTKHCECILVNADDIMCLSMNPKSISDHLDQSFLLKHVKPESRGQPQTHLRADIDPCPHQHEPDVCCWSVGSHTCVKEAMRNVETHLDELGLALKKKVSTVVPNGDNMTTTHPAGRHSFVVDFLRFEGPKCQLVRMKQEIVCFDGNKKLHDLVET